MINEMLAPGLRKSMGLPDVEHETILDEAKRLVLGDREKTYDHPNKNFARTASLLNAYFYDRGMHFTTHDVGMIMIMLKLAREKHRHTRDNLVDIAGYTECLARVMGDDE